MSKKQLKAINAALSLIEGEATQQQLETIVRSVMTPKS